MDDKSFFVAVYEPIDVRRNLLESSRELVSGLQKRDELKKIRELKIKYVDEMKILMSEIDFLILKLKTRLPKTNLRKGDQKIDYVKRDKGPTLNTEMKKLEQEFRKIEREFSNT